MAPSASTDVMSAPNVANDNLTKSSMKEDITEVTLRDDKPSSERLLVWTVCAYRKPGMSEEDYHRYMSEKHAPLVRDLMVKYKFIRWSMSHNTTETRSTYMSQLVGPQFANEADYDCFVQVVFRDINEFVRMKADPFFKEKVMPDHENFADTKRSRMTVGWIEDHIRDGKAVYNSVEGDAGRQENNGQDLVNGNGVH